MNKAKIIIISGPSGSGKDTVIRGILKKFPSLVMVKSYTTRPKRKSDEVGNRYFVNKIKFEQMIKNNEFLEYKKFCGNLYGRTKKDIMDLLEHGKYLIMEVDVKGTLDYQKIFDGRIVTIFVKYQNPQQLVKRIKKTRPEISQSDLANRLKTMAEELKYEKYYNHSVINPEGHPEKATEEVAKIIRGKLKI